MGAFTTILSFGAGYALGTRRDVALGRFDETLRSLTGKYLPRTERAGARSVRDVMTPVPETVGPDATLVQAAALMADGGIGDVLVVDPSDGMLVGIATDRDIIIRAVAAERDPRTTAVRSVLSGDLETIHPDETVADAVAHMRAANVRRLPVVDEGRPIGVVSLADLARATDTTSTLADIAVAPPDR
ncbi:MAG TPA: CBS domain-containing protein [Actinomycetota bacterium]|nr:CBS domain-containing protein [Actinomycetota bacterium]